MKKMIAMLLCLVMPLTAFGCVGAFAEATDQKVEVTDQMVEPTLPVVDFGPQSEEVEKALIAEAEKLPDKLDLRAFEGKNYVTPVKNQSPYGSCWTFGITAAVEISFLHDNGFGVPAGEVNDLVDFSEKYISWFVRHPITEEEVQTGHVRASQLSEGYDPGEAEKTALVHGFQALGNPMTPARRRRPTSTPSTTSAEARPSTPAFSRAALARSPSWRRSTAGSPTPIAGRTGGG